MSAFYRTSLAGAQISLGVWGDSHPCVLVPQTGMAVSIGRVMRQTIPMREELDATV